MRRFVSAMTIASLLAAYVPAAQAASPQLIGRFDAWHAFRLDSGSTRLCYLLSTPVERLPAGLKRGPAYLFVAHHLSDNDRRSEISLELGFPLDAASTSTLLIGTTEFELAEKGEQAWLSDERDHPKAIAALKRALAAIVRTTSTRGNETRDAYTLRGFTRAYGAITDACEGASDHVS
jgi:hypothetical protein